MSRQKHENETVPWDELAPYYHERVITPFAQTVRFRLRRDVRHSLQRWRDEGSVGWRVVMDFGCGCGDALLLVAGHVGFGGGLDYSEGMLNQAQTSLEEAGVNVTRYSRKGGIQALAHRINCLKQKKVGEPQTVLVNADLRHLGPIHRCVDLGMVINSIVASDAQDVSVIFREVTACIKDSGFCIFVFPSIDSVRYLLKLVRRYKVAVPEFGVIEPDAGIFVDPGNYKQKFFTPEEIRDLFDSDRWTVSVMEKIYYPWDLIRDFGWGYFPRHGRLWDWYVIAHPGKK